MWKILYSAAIVRSRNLKRSYAHSENYHSGVYDIQAQRTHIKNMSLIMYAVSIYYSIQIAAKLSFSLLCLL